MTFYIDYEIKYAEIHSTLISNQCGPTVDIVNHQFFKDLQRDILENGFRNPILVIAGECDSPAFKHLPKKMQDDPNEILWCGGNGGSRLWVAQRHRLEIPCIISDHIDRFPEATILNSIDEIKACYEDQPEVLVTKRRVSISILPGAGPF